MNDDELIRRLRDLLPPVPGHVLGLGHDAYRWFVPDATLAVLTRDLSETPAGVRGGAARRLTFNGPAVSVRIEVCDREIVGRLEPPAEAEVILRSPGGRRGARTDGAGAFVLPDVPSGPVSLLFRLPDATSVVTSWIRV